mgnify:CR=1 FL=1
MPNDTLPVTPHLSLLQPYPFERLKELTAGISGPAHLPLVRLSIGEPQHATPQLIKDALTGALDGLAVYPTTAGIDALREPVHHGHQHDQEEYDFKIGQADACPTHHKCHQRQHCCGAGV